MTKALSLRDKIKNRVVRGERVEIPEWDTAVFVRGLTALEAHELYSQEEDAELPTSWENAIKFCLDADGEPLFKAEDAEWLKNEPATALMRIAQAYRRLNRVDDENIEEAKKN